MEFLPHDVIELVLERLDARTLLTFKSVSKQWKSSMESPRFQKRQHRRTSGRRGGDPHVLLVSSFDASLHHPDFEALRTLIVGSSDSVKIPTPWENKSYEVCNTSCDGLICLFDLYDLPSIVVNPTTRWYRTFPSCNYQLVATERRRTGEDDLYDVPYPSPGFGLDKTNGIYKPVYLYNSAELGLNNNATTCEVFDFATNAWRYVVPASPYTILHLVPPVYLDGSLHWFTTPSHEGETMVLSFDLHTEIFQVITKAPFFHAPDTKIRMCNLDDRLCVSEDKCPNQVIWSLEPDHKTWKQIYCIDFTITYNMFPFHALPLTPLAVLDKDKLLFYNRENEVALVKHDPKTKSYDLVYSSKTNASALCYFPSLISIL